MKQKQKDLDEISGKQLDDKVFYRLIPFLKPYRWQFSVAIVMIFLSASVSIYTPKLLGQIIDDALLQKNQSLLVKLVILFGTLEIVRLLCLFTQSIILQKIGQYVMQNIRKKLYAKLIRMPVSFFDKSPIGKLVTRITNDTVNLSELFSSGFVVLLSDFLIIFGVIGILIYIHPKLGLITISIFPLMILTMVVFSNRLRIAFRNTREVLAKLNAFFAERASGMNIIQMMEKEQYESKQYQALSLDYRIKQFRGVHLYALFQPIITILSACSVALVILFGPNFMRNGEIPLGTLVAYLAYVQVLYQPVRNITDRFNIFLAAMASAERIFTLLDMKEEEDTPQKTNTESGKTSNDLTFKNVTFTYPSIGSVANEPALKNLNLHIHEGSTVAIVGHTGAGKTTITSLLLRFYSPEEGEIFIGDKNIQTLGKKELRSQIGYLQQEVFFFSGTVRDNLTIFNKSASEATILRACKDSGFSEVLEKMKLGLDSLLDERATNLSLGERQLLAFTRVFIQAPKILILDEATASIDHHTEEKIQHSLKTLLKGKTTLVIAHRLETVKHADKILVMEKGQIIENGNHQELMSKNGKYAHFVNLQNSLQSLEV
ncbi:MAG: ABC transporter ATP-binding protein/permease [Oligoflexia bacterium]|nr:ABC transporter ATP-binding protein/permease [Oligoflexia bacterium]